MHTKEITQHRASCVWLLGITLSGCVCVAVLYSVLYLIFHRTATLHCVYPLVSPRPFGMFTLFGHYEQECCERSCTSFCVNMFLILSGTYAGVKLLGHIVTICLTFPGIAKLLFKALSASDGTTSRSHWQCASVSLSSHPHPPLSFFFPSLKNCSHPRGDEVVSHFGSDVNFPND